jgi:hypothetical protein
MITRERGAALVHAGRVRERILIEHASFRAHHQDCLAARRRELDPGRRFWHT